MRLKEYFQKFKGTSTPPPRVPLTEVFWSFIGGFLGVSICGLISSYFLEPRGLTLFIGSMGASAVLVYGAIKSPFAQPRNVVGGHFFSALMGVISYKLIGEPAWLSGALAVALAILAMHLTRTLHPPGGATALIAVIGGEKIHNLSFVYPFIPATLGAMVLVLVGIFVNNLPRHRKYPEYWY
jgi:CBS-domain-containing membrane protein